MNISHLNVLKHSINQLIQSTIPHMNIYLIRHGETAFNRQGIIQGSGVDSNLNELGNAQAQAFYQRYRDVDFQLVVTSELRRTHQTAGAFLNDGIPWLQMREINEICWGVHEGKLPTEATNAVFRQVISDWQNGQLTSCMQEGESAADLVARLEVFINWLHTRPAERLLVVTHGRTMRCLCAMLKGLGPENMETQMHTNTGLYLIRLHEGQFIFDKENDTEHLSDLTSNG